MHSPTSRSRTMHRLWLVEDVVREILIYCSLPTTNALGRTCQFLCRIYMDVAYEDLPNLEPLYALLSMKSQDKAARRFLGRITSGNSTESKQRLYNRITMYTTRVKSMTVDGIEDARQLRQLQELVHPLPLPALFPQLRFFHVVASSPDTVRESAFFTFPNAERVSMDVEFHDEPLDVKGSQHTSTLPAFFPALRDVTSLDSLRLNLMSTPREASVIETHSLVSLFRRLPYLKTIIIQHLTFDEGFVSFLSSMPALEHLQIRLSESDELQSTSLPFVHLRDLTFNCDTLQGCIWFLNNAHAQGLQRLRLFINVPELPNAFSQKLGKLISRKFPSLKAFAVNHKDVGKPVVSHFSAFSGISSCHDMSRLCILPDTSLVVTDEDLLRLSRRCPRLEEVTLGGTPVVPAAQQLSGPMPYPTLTGLSLLAWGCPELDRLKLSMCFTAAPKDAGLLMNAPCSPSQLTSLSVDSYPGSQSRALPARDVASIITRLFPKLQTFEYCKETGCKRIAGPSRPLTRREVQLVLEV